MAIKSFAIEDVVQASTDTVWSLLADSSTWPDWTSIDSHEQERPGGPSGTGERRVFRTGRYCIREEIVEKRPHQRLSYTLLSGLAVRDYRADIDLERLADDRTAITWRTRFTPGVPGTGWLYRRTLLRFTRGFVDGLSKRSTAIESGQAQ